jgi:hypothetical protein
MIIIFFYYNRINFTLFQHNTIWYKRLLYTSYNVPFWTETASGIISAMCMCACIHMTCVGETVAQMAGVFSFNAEICVCVCVCVCVTVYVCDCDTCEPT